MISQAATSSQPVYEAEERGPDLEDPFAGLLGHRSLREDLWLGRAVPRYTSYPPATAFQDGVTAMEYRAVLEALSPEEPVSLYLHIPYCQALCLYCGCHTTATRQHERVTRYLDSVHREIEHIALAAPRARRIAHIHFGGGSPNIMSEKDLGLMFGALSRRFDLSACKEIAMELDPRLVTKAQAKALGLTGVTRVSLGVQDFDPIVQEAIGRVQPYEQVAEACAMLRAQGVDNINFDLMYGLPHQSPVTMMQTARKAVALRPERISLFSYAHVPQVKKHQKALEQYMMPGPHAALAMERAAREELCDAGYIEIGMDHFARPKDALAKALREGRLRRNFQGYTDDAASAMLGIGASSIGFASGAYYQNARDTEAYQDKIAENGFATMRGLRLTSEDRVRGAIIQSLMCAMSVNLEAICRAHHYSLSAFSREVEALKQYEEAGLIRMEGYTISLTTPYRMAIRVVASIFDTTTREENAPVSRVV